MRDSVNVVIAGAGPSGLLLAHYLLTYGDGKFHVQLFDRDEDPKVVEKQGPSIRRYSMGLNPRGLQCIDAIPGLLSKVLSAAFRNTHLVISLNSKTPFVVSVGNEKKDPKYAAHLIDRVSLTAALYDELISNFGNSELLSVQFSTRCISVDLSRRTALFTPKGDESDAPNGPSSDSPPAITSVTYNLLVGADGARSVVRGAFLSQSPGFCMEFRDIFSHFVSSHIPRPPDYSEGSMHIFPRFDNAEGLQGIAMAHSAETLSFSIGWQYSRPCTKFIELETPEQAKKFFDDRVPYLNIPQEAAWSLHSQPFRSSNQVKCFPYHDVRGMAVLVGDAAHATSPAIGQGCNSSLCDIAVLARLLLGLPVNEENRVPKGASEFAVEDSKRLTVEQIKTRLPTMLELYSVLQVKEGHAVVDLSWSDIIFANKAIHTVYALSGIVRAKAHSLLPFIVRNSVLSLVSTTTVPYSQILSYTSTALPVCFWNDWVRSTWVRKQMETKALTLLGGEAAGGRRKKASNTLLYGSVFIFLALMLLAPAVTAIN